jgi:hypothetical protein
VRAIGVCQIQEIVEPPGVITIRLNSEGSGGAWESTLGYKALDAQTERPIVRVVIKRAYDVIYFGKLIRRLLYCYSEDSVVIFVIVVRVERCEGTHQKGSGIDMSASPKRRPPDSSA